MKKKSAVLGLLMLLSMVLYGQETQRLNILIQQSSMLVECADQVVQLNDSIQREQARIRQLRADWRQTCMTYLQSDQPSLEDLNYLIACTDPIEEETLYESLVKAAHLLRMSSGTPLLPAPQPTTGKETQTEASNADETEETDLSKQVQLQLRKRTTVIK